MPKVRTTTALVLFIALVITCAAYGQTSKSAGSAQPQKSPCDGLVGTWQGPESTIELKRDGTTEVNGIKYRYSANGSVITLAGMDGTFNIPYQLKGETLVVLVNGQVQTFKCVVPGTTPEVNASGGSGQLSEQLLLSSAWCTFSYNKVTGYSNSTRYVFYPDGTYGTGSRGEGYSSGYGGTMASQHDSRTLGRWKVVNGVLYLGQTSLQPVQAYLKRSSNGPLTVVADGTEYVQCK